MSINVTVTGNPIKIHRGKLITSDIDQDVDKRRKLRLQQVRQQSKELAAAVRNNVKRAKSKQQSNFEKQNQAKLKEWQNKKLLQLQNVYEESIRDIGAGHAQAQVSEFEENQQMERKKIINDEMASRRGRSAQEMLQVRKNEHNLQKAIPRQAKQIAREVENARAAMIVSQAHKKTPKKKKLTKGHFTVEPESPTKNIVPDTDDIEQEPVSSSRHLTTPKSPIQSKEPSNVQIAEVQTFASIESYSKAESVTKSPTKRFRHETIPSSNISMQSLDIPPDTRISDRIRSRHLMTAPMSDIPEATCSSPSQNFEFHEIKDDNKENKQTNRAKVFSTSTQPGVSIPSTLQNDCNIVTCPVCVKHTTPFSHGCACPNVKTVCVPNLQICTHHPNQGFEIPCKPSVRLAKETYAPQYSQKDSASNQSKEYRKVKTYDHKNRFAHHYITDTTHVHQIQDDELEYSDLEAGPSFRPQTNREFSKMADERAKMADIRGKKALEKESIRKDYAQLMKKLPLLQKQGRIANLDPSKDKLHMSDARRQEFEKQRQEKMERAFEKVAPTTITLQEHLEKSSSSPPRQKSPVRLKKTPEKAKLVKKPIATWKTTAEASTSAQSPETSNLISLLQKLRSQKEELLKESKDLPQDSNFYNLIDELDFVAKPKAKTKDNKDKKVQTDSRKQSTTDLSRKMHKQVLILQNTSTQTSPKVSKAPSNVGTESSDAEPPVKQQKTDVKHEKVVHSKNGACACKERDKLCEILIKIRDCPAHSDSKKDESSDESGKKRLDTDPKRTVEETLNLETGSRKTPHTKPDDCDCNISPKRSRSESPKKAPRKIEKEPSREVSPKKAERLSSRITTNESWKHHLSTGSSRYRDEITSSTSYYSPPDYNMQEIPRNHPSNHLNQGGTQTENIPLDNKLLLYINRMLEISKGKLNHLAANVSSISDVPTPASSVINMRSNRPQRAPSSKGTNHNDSTQIEQLSSLLKYFNLTPGDFRSFISVQSASSQPRTRSNSVASSSQSIQSRNSRSATPGNFGLSLDNYTQTPSTATNDQFAQWAEICQARINSLVEMIDRVRMERKEILSPSENVTSYMKLPQSDSQRSGSSSPHSPSLEQQQLNRQLLEVDVRDGNTSKTRGTSTTGANDSKDLQKLLELSKDYPDLDRDIVERYMQLVGVELQAQRSKSPEIVPTSKSPEKNVSFKPMLDIPKLPKLQLQPQVAGPSYITKNKKPPVTNNALRFNDVIHELSAIPEAENSRLSKSPASRKSASPQKRIVPHKSPSKSLAISTKKLATKSSSSDASIDSPASEQSNESVESMLKNIGLNWAINNLKKMNAANKNSSRSSSSSDIDPKNLSSFIAKNVSTSIEKLSPSPYNLSHLQRTSTPVQTASASKGSTNQKLFHSGESDISPVVFGQRENEALSCDCSQQTFRTLPSHTIHDESDS